MLIAVGLVVAATPGVPNLDLICTLLPQESHMRVRCSIDLPAEYTKKGKIEFRLGDQMSLPKVRIAGAEVVPSKVSQVDHDVRYSISTPSEPKTVRVDFDYESVNPKGFVYLLSPKSCFAGGYNTLWFPAFGDARRMLGTMTFETPSEFLVKASGRELASAVEGTVRTSRFRMENPIVPTFASAPYHVVKIPGKVPVTMYLLKPRDVAGRFAKGCADILGVLEREFGPYPYPDFSIIETPSPESTQLGFSGASFEGFMFGDSNSVDSGFNLAYFGHEMSHQWWGNLVQMTDGKGGYVFSEGLAQFGSLQAVLHLEGAAMAKQYRLHGYPGYSTWQCTLGALAFVVTGYDKPLSFDPPENSGLQHDLADSKGFLAWQTLARVMGPENFRAGIRDIAKQKAWASISWDDLWRVLQARAKVDLAPYRKQWFERTGLPTTWTEWKQEGSKVEVTLRQKEPAFRLKMPLIVRFKDGGSVTREVEFAQLEQNLRLVLDRPVLSVELDPDHETLHSTPELDAKMGDLKDFALVDCIFNLLRDRPDAEKVLTEALTRIPRPDKHGAEFLLRFTLGGVFRGAGRNAEAKEQLELALLSPVRDQDFVPAAYLRLARAYEALGDKVQVQKCLDAMVSSEASLRWPTGTLLRAKQLFPDHRF